jgi:5-formyltetrahydrofolate cyclo-ligase
MKSSLRAEARRRVARLSDAERELAGAAVAARVWTLPEFERAKVWLLYAALPGEVPTAPIAAEARRRAIELVYPRCLPGDRAIALHRVAAEDQLQAGQYGIPEPGVHCPEVSLAEIDAALIPGLAWDRAGHRLGRGAGYYDRLLASPHWRGFACGLFFAAQEVDLIPADEWDVAMDAVVTEREVVRVRKDE